MYWYGIKKWKNVLCLVVVGLFDLHTIRCYKCGEERGVWWFMAKSLTSKRRRGKSMWVMCGFEFCLSVSLFLSLSFSLSLSLSLRVRVLVCGVCLASFDLTLLSRNLSFISFFSSDQIKLGFLCFFTTKVTDWPKITFTYFYFLTNFIDISLCADPMCRNPLFHFEESLSTNHIWWMLSWALVAIIILCVR